MAIRWKRQRGIISSRAKWTEAFRLTDWFERKNCAKPKLERSVVTAIGWNEDEPMPTIDWSAERKKTIHLHLSFPSIDIDEFSKVSERLILEKSMITFRRIRFTWVSVAVGLNLSKSEWTSGVDWAQQSVNGRKHLPSRGNDERGFWTF